MVVDRTFITHPDLLAILAPLENGSTLEELISYIDLKVAEISRFFPYPDGEEL